MQGPANLQKYIDAIENPILLKSRIDVEDCYEHSYKESHIPVKDGIAYCRTSTAAEYLCRFRSFRMMQPSEIEAPAPSLAQKATGAAKTAGKTIVETVRKAVGGGKKKPKRRG